MPLGTAYAIWTGLGTVGTFALGVYLFQDAFLYPESHLRFAYLIRDCRLEIIALKRCATTANSTTMAT
ncbi:multidrug efflux SMR transporter [Fibrobacter sp.]|uniref:DMT family transporter n=1 Tax=Fibrobacter sp. TaxID=35828 RepID=UPI00345D3540